MIQMIRESDGAPANAGSETEAELLTVQGYRRVERPAPAQAEQPTEPPASEQVEQPVDGATGEESASPASRRRGASS